MTPELEVEIDKAIQDVHRSVGAAERQMAIINRLHERSNVLCQLFWELHAQLSVYEPGDPSGADLACEIVILNHIFQRTAEEIKDRWEFLCHFNLAAVRPATEKLHFYKKVLESKMQ